MTEKRYPNPLRRLIATSPNPKRPKHIPDPQAFTDEPPTVSRTIEAEVALLASYYRRMTARQRAETLREAERRANGK